MRKFPTIRLLAAIAALGQIDIAMAHTPYVMPNVFDVPERGVVSLDATFGEELFVPDYPVENTVFYVLTPEGTKVEPASLTQLQTRTIVEHQLDKPGTYRFSTGWYEPAPMKRYLLNGETKTLRGANATIPEGAQPLKDLQYRLMAETYVTKGAPSLQPLAARGKGLEFVPRTHPNKVFAGEKFEFQLLLDGRPLPSTAVELHLGKRQPQDSEPLYKSATDDGGVAAFVAQDDGIYLLRAGTTVPGDEVSTVDLQYVVTMTLEIVE